MLLIEYREHDGLDQFRVWTEQDACYGTFRIVTRAELQIIIRACTLFGGLCRPADDALIDPIKLNDFPINCPSLCDVQIQRESIAST